MSVAEKNVVPYGSVVDRVHSIFLQNCADWPRFWIGPVAVCVAIWMWFTVMGVSEKVPTM